MTEEYSSSSAISGHVTCMAEHRAAGAAARKDTPMNALDVPDIVPRSTPALDALRGPLTGILGAAQLLQRRLLRGESLPLDDTLAALAGIQRSVWALEGQLRALEDAAYRKRD
jgi:hypothetical protein